MFFCGLSLNTSLLQVQKILLSSLVAKRSKQRNTLATLVCLLLCLHLNGFEYFFSTGLAVLRKEIDSQSELKMYCKLRLFVGPLSHSFLKLEGVRE